MTHVYLGDYEVVSHLETPECSLMLLKLTKDKFVRLHHHHKITHSRRQIALPPALAVILRAHRARQKQDRLIQGNNEQNHC